MKFTVESEALVKGLNAVKDAMKKSTVPILQHIAVDAKLDHIVVRATNMAMELKAEISASVEVPGEAAMPGVMLATLASGLAKGSQAEFEMIDERVKITSGRSKFDLPTLPVEEFPSRSELAGDGVVSFSVSGPEFRKLLDSTVYPTGPKNPHLYSQGVHLHVTGTKLRAVATDHFRLALREMPCPRGAKGMVGVTIPLETVCAIMGMLDKRHAQDDIAVLIGKGIIEVHNEGVRVASALIDCEFPEYERVIPKPNGRSAEFSRDELIEAVRRASVAFLGITDIKNKQQTIKFEAVDGALTVMAQSHGSGEESIDAEISKDPISDLVSAPHLLEMLGAWPEGVTVRMHQAAPTKGILFECKEHPGERHVIMPCLF
jgi:DNA polymerase-3 subunit beta